MAARIISSETSGVAVVDVVAIRISSSNGNAVMSNPGGRTSIYTSSSSSPSLLLFATGRRISRIGRITTNRDVAVARVSNSPIPITSIRTMEACKCAIASILLLLVLR